MHQLFWQTNVVLGEEQWTWLLLVGTVYKHKFHNLILV